jgi:hypothetical protein
MKNLGILSGRGSNSAIASNVALKDSARIAVVISTT